MAVLRLRTLQQRLIALGVVLAVIPLLVQSLAQRKWHSELVFLLVADGERQGRSELSRAVALVQASCLAVSASLKTQLRSQLGAAESLLAERGGAQVIRGWNQRWTARDQDTGQAQQVKLPVMVVGKAGEGPASTSRYVEGVRKATGAHATLFQRLNADNDMLSVATTVRHPGDQSAAGTVVSARGRNGHLNPAIEAVLAGRQYFGRATVSGAASFVAYAPLADPKGAVIGMLSVAVPEAESAEGLRAVAEGLKLGRSGGVTMIAASELAGRKGTLAERILSAARGLTAGQEARFRASGVSGITADSREHEFALRYSPEWDWVLVASVPVDEVLETAGRISAESRKTQHVTAKLAAAGLLLSVLAWWQVTRRWSARVSKHVRSLEQASRSILVGAKRVRATAVGVAGFANRQSAAVAAVTGDIAHLSQLGVKFSRTAVELTRAAAEVKQSACAGSATTRKVSTSMKEIDQAGRSVARIMSVINEIAMQTNLLALNAAVEAARAGKAGLGFAVVADGVRALASRASQAAQETSTLIEGALGSSSRGAALASDAAASLSCIETKSARLDELAVRLSEEASVQTSRFTEIREAVAGIKASGRETSKASELAREVSGEMAAQARRLQATADALSALFLSSRD